MNIFDVEPLSLKIVFILRYYQLPPSNFAEFTEVDYMCVCSATVLYCPNKEEDTFEASDDSREPPLKKRRTVGSSTSESCSNEPQESEEDTIPFTENDYEPIAEKTKMSHLRVSCNNSSAVPDDTEHQPDVGYSSGENSASDSLNDPSFKKAMEGVNEDESHLCIDSSPVKGYYKTVPLDDAGVTDTEVPRLTASSIFLRKSANDVLTDSLVVNIEENTGVYSGDEMEDILALLDDEYGANAEKKYFQAQIECIKQGTKWREISSSQRNKRCSQGSLPVYRQNSCDASSEESEDDLRGGSLTSFTKPHCNNRSISLKRPYISKSSNTSSLFKNSLLNVESSTPARDSYLCNLTASQCSEPSTSSIGALSPARIPSYRLRVLNCPVDRVNTKRRSRTRRLPRSASDIDRLNNLMSMSTHSAPGFFGNSSADSDESSQEQSDAPPYEWDDYNPPVKAEEDGNMDKANQQSVVGLGIYDDLQMQFADVKGFILESRASLRSANALLNRQPTRQSLEDLKTMASGQADRLSVLAVNRRFSPEDSADFEEVSKGWRKLLSAVESLTSSPLSFKLSTNNESIRVILSKIEKFASSLKFLQDAAANDLSNSPMCSVSSIKSLDDVESTLKVFGDIREKLVTEREELLSLLHSDTLSGDLVELTKDFELLPLQYGEAIEKVEQLVKQVEKVKRNWSDWAETQSNLQNTIMDIEKELVAMRRGSDNCNQIASELELCQERMNRLETVCNYLTMSLSELPEDSSASKALDFDAEVKKYYEAIGKLKDRFEELRNLPVSDTSESVPSPGSFENKCEASSCAETNIKASEKVQQQHFYHHHHHHYQHTQQQKQEKQHNQLYSMSWQVVLLLCSTALAFLAWFVSFNDGATNNWKNALGLHVDYVNGPPPV